MIFECMGHNWSSDEGKYCPHCINDPDCPTPDWEDFDPETDEKKLCKMKWEKKDGGYEERYACHPSYLPLQKDYFIEGSFEYLD